MWVRNMVEQPDMRSQITKNKAINYLTDIDDTTTTRIYQLIYEARIKNM